MQMQHILPTKAGQYKRLKQLKRDVIEHKETAKRVVGTKSVQMAEKLLQKVSVSFIYHDNLLNLLPIMLDKLCSLKDMKLENIENLLLKDHTYGVEKIFGRPHKSKIFSYL